MFSRVRQTATWTLTVGACYFVYVSLVAPAIVPAETPPPEDDPHQTAASRAYPFEHWFPADAWERNRPVVVVTNKGTLLFDESTQSDDGLRLDLARCTLVFYPGTQQPTTEDRPIILRAPGGASLFLDSPLDMAQMKVGRISAGSLAGPVTIDGPPSEPGADDALHIETANVRIDEHRIWTRAEVSFRFGSNVGRGRELWVYLDDRLRAGETDEPSAGQLDSLEVLHVDQLQLQLAAKIFSAQDKEKDAGPNTVTISCAGPFRFDFRELTGSLRDNVLVRQGSGPGGDELTCESLKMYFDEEPATDDERPQGRRRAEARRLVAEGLPVRVEAPSQKLSAQAQRIEYDLAKRSLKLTDRKRLRLRNEQFEVLAPAMTYTFVTGEQLGQFWAEGPGELKGQFGEDAQPVEATWDGEVRLQPGTEASEKVLTVNGARQVSLNGIGNLSSDTLQIFLSESPQANSPQRTGVEIKRLLAHGNVVADSPDMTARLDVAKIWFRKATPADQPARQGLAPKREFGTGNDQHPQVIGKPRTRFLLQAEKLHALVVLGQEATLERLDVAGGVELTEEGAPPQSATYVRADAFKLEDGTTSNPIAYFFGRPAEGRAAGLEFSGELIEIHQGRNSVRIPQAGRMALTPPQRPGGAKLPPIHIQWAGQMEFTGQSGYFADRVQLSGSHPTKEGNRSIFTLNGERMEFSLTQPVSFVEPQRDVKTELNDARFPGWVAVESRLFDGQGRPQSFDQMEIRNVQLNAITGNVVGQGPGWLTHRGVPRKLGNSRFQSQSSQLQYLRIDFADRLTGNIHQREAVFHENVRCLFGGINDWQQELRFGGRPTLGEQDFYLTSDLLEVVDLAGTDSVGGGLELHAIGNALISGRLFTGSGNSLSYVKAKDQVIIDSDGRNDAVLTYQQTLQSAPNEMYFEKGIFYPNADPPAYQLEGMRATEVRLDQLQVPGR